MNVSLTPELEKYVSDKVGSGLYNSASEVVREGLRLLREKDELQRHRLEELRRQIQVGVDQADRGQLSPFNEETLEEIREVGRKRIAARRKSGSP